METALQAYVEAAADVLPLYEQLYPYFGPMRLFGMLTFQTAAASITALLLSVMFGPWLIRKLREFQIGQYIREEGPKSHQKKSGTPTMGGIMIIFTVVVPTLLFANLRNKFIWIAMFALVAFGFIGFWG